MLLYLCSSFNASYFITDSTHGVEGHGRCEVGPKNWWEVMVLKIGRRREVDLKNVQEVGDGRLTGLFS